MTIGDSDPRRAEPAVAPPIEEEPSTTGLVVDGDADDESSGPPADQQTALHDAVERGEPDGSAAAGA